MGTLRSPSAALPCCHRLLAVLLSIPIFPSNISQWKWSLATHYILLYQINTSQTLRYLVTTIYTHIGFLSVTGDCLHCDIKAELAAHAENEPANMAWNIARGCPIKCVKLCVRVWSCSVQGDTSGQADTWTGGMLWSQLLWGLLARRNAGMTSESWHCSAL